MCTANISIANNYLKTMEASELVKLCIAGNLITTSPKEATY